MDIHLCYMCLNFLHVQFISFFLYHYYLFLFLFFMEDFQCITSSTVLWRAKRESCFVYNRMYGYINSLPTMSKCNV